MKKTYFDKIVLDIFEIKNRLKFHLKGATRIYSSESFRLFLYVQILEMQGAAEYTVCINLYPRYPLKRRRFGWLTNLFYIENDFLRNLSIWGTVVSNSKVEVNYPSVQPFKFSHQFPSHSPLSPPVTHPTHIHIWYSLLPFPTHTHIHHPLLPFPSTPTSSTLCYLFPPTHYNYSITE